MAPVALMLPIASAGPIGEAAGLAVNWLLANGQGVFDAINALITALSVYAQQLLMALPPLVFASAVACLGFWRVGGPFALLSLIGLNLVLFMGLWDAMVSTLALVLAASLLALITGFPLGVLAAKQRWVWTITRPMLDLMQTMPAFVYLIPAVMLFSTGAVPSIIATLIFSMPPVVRLTMLGIRQVPDDLLEAGRSFGCSDLQLLSKVQLPHALPTVMTGVNQTIMLALSMVVIASMIGGGGLGDVVLRGIQQLNIGLGFEGGLAVVILAVILDRLTQSLSTPAATPLPDRLHALIDLWRVR